MNEDREEDYETPKQKAGGKKSGSMLTAAETIQDHIDWPHMHVSRINTGGLKGVPFNKLRMEEFVYGFISMIESPRCKWDYRTMESRKGHD